MAHEPVDIPTVRSFLEQWGPWIHSKVSRHFKRDKGRIHDTVQNARIRLLSKDFIGRWFFKHLRDELVDLAQAERILGGTQVTFVGHIPTAGVTNWSCLGNRLAELGLSKSEVSDVCAHVRGGGAFHKAPHVARLGRDGRESVRSGSCVRRFSLGLSCSRACPHSLWRVSDLLRYARFDHERYYYSVQGHTIDTPKVLRLLGYPPDAFESLASLYRQGRLRPAELTEHECSGTKSCLGCRHGRELLRGRGLSLAHRWDDPSVRDQVLRLRWNDSQLTPFLRNWRRGNAVSATPLYIMREPDARGRVLDVSAGLLKYAEIIIGNEVVNDFKRMSRTDDVSRMVFNNGMSPEFSNEDTVAYEGEDEGSRPQQVFRDTSSLDEYVSFERRRDVTTLIEQAGLTDEEKDAITAVELMEMTVRQYSEATGVPVPRIHRVRASALRKLRGDDVPVDEVLAAACRRHGCSPEDLTGPDMFGPCVLARTEAFSELFDRGMSVESISDRLGYPQARVAAAINRMVLREMRQNRTA